MLYIAAMDIVTFSEARANLKAVMDRACADRAPVVVKRARGQENVVIVPQGEWEGMQETLHLLASPANAKRLMEGIARLDAGEGEEHELIQP
jgi:antitoxin YefM